MAFLFFWQGLHTFAHLLHTLQKSHEFFASLAQRVFRCTKKRILREEHPRQLAAFLCVHLPDGFKDQDVYKRQAIMLSALMINGLNPGLSLFTTDGAIMYAIMPVSYTHLYGEMLLILHIKNQR